jgi:CTD kinase subunit alpha
VLGKCLVLLPRPPFLINFSRCIMLELFRKKPVFQGNDEIHQLDVIYKFMGTPTPEIWPGYTDLPWYELVKPAEPISSRFRSIFDPLVKSLLPSYFFFDLVSIRYLSPAALDLAESLLSFDPSKRVTAAAALEAPYFTTEEPAAELPVG